MRVREVGGWAKKGGVHQTLSQSIRPFICQSVDKWVRDEPIEDKWRTWPRMSTMGLASKSDGPNGGEEKWEYLLANSNGST